MNNLEDHNSIDFVSIDGDVVAITTYHVESAGHFRFKATKRDGKQLPEQHTHSDPKVGFLEFKAMIA